LIDTLDFEEIFAPRYLRLERSSSDNLPVSEERKLPMRYNNNEPHDWRIDLIFT